MILGAWVGAAWGAGASHAGDESERFHSWLRETMGLDRGMLRSGSAIYRLEYRVEFLYTLTPEEFARIRRRVEGRPEHPDRVLLGLEQRLIRPDVDEFVLWLNGDEFRRSVRRVSGGSTVLDDVQTARVAWRMTPEALIVARDGDKISPGGIARYLEGHLDDALVLLTGGVHRAVHVGASPRGRLAPDGSWEAEAVQPIGGGEWRLHASGRWDAATGTGEVRQVRITRRAPDGALTGQIIEAAGWRTVEGLARPVASEALERRLDGAPDRRVVFGSLRTVDRREFARVVDVPAINAVDEFRGPVTFREIYDHRGPESRLLRIDDAGVVTEQAAPRSAATTDNTKHARLRVAGWILAGVTLSVVIWLRLRARRARA